MAANQGGQNLFAASASLNLDISGFMRSVGQAAKGITGQLGTATRVGEKALATMGEAAKKASTLVGSVGKGVGGLTDVLGKVGLASLGIRAITDSIGRLASAFRDPIFAASDLGESISKVNVLLGDSAGLVHEFARTADRALGLSRNQAEAAAGAYANIFRSMGIGQKETAKLSVDLVKLAGDLASFNNLDVGGPDGTLAKLQAGIVGETEPLRTLGVLLNETTLKQELLAMGAKQVNGQFAEGDKVMARYRIILRQTAAAQGDFARTSAGLANGMRIIRASLANFSATMGQRFLSTVEPFVVLLARTLPNIFEVLTPVLDDAGGAVKAFGDRLRESLNTDALVGGLGRALDGVRTFIGALRGRWEVAPGIGEFAERAGRLALIIRGTVLGALDLLRGAFRLTSEVVERAITPMLPALSRARDALLTFTGALRGDWGGAVASNIDRVVRQFGVLGLFLRSTGQAIGKLLGGGGFGEIQDVLTEFADNFGIDPKVFTTLFDGLKQGPGPAVTAALTLLANGRARIIEQLGSWGKEFAAWVGPAIPGMLRELGGVVDAVVRFAIGNVSRVGSEFAKWGDAIFAWAGEVAPNVERELAPIATSVVSWIGSTASLIAETSKTEWVPGLLDWVADATEKLLPELSKYTSRFSGWFNTDAGTMAGEAVAKFVPALVDWVTEAIKQLDAQLPRISSAIAKFVVETEVPDMSAFGSQFGSSMRRAIEAGLQENEPQIQAMVDRIVAGDAANWTPSSLMLAALRKGLDSQRPAGTQGGDPLAAIGEIRVGPIDDMLAQVQTSFSNMVASVGQSLDAFGTMVSGAWDGAVATVSGALATIQTDAATGWASVSGSVSAALTGLGGIVQGAFSTTVGTVTGIFEQIKGSVVGVWKSVPEDIRADLVLISTVLAQRFANMVQTVLTTLLGLGPAAVAAVTGAANSVGESLGQLGSTISEAFGGAASGAGAAISGLGQTILTVLGGLALSVAGPVLATVAAISEPLAAVVETVGASMATFATNVGTIWNGISTSASQIWGAVSTAITGPIAEAITSMTGSWDTAQADTESTWAAVSSAITTAASEATSAISSFASGIAGAIAGAASGVLAEAQAIGANLLNGIVAGFQSAGSGLGGAAADMVRGLLRTTKQVAQIRSPSGLTAREIGEPLAEGIAVGFQGVDLSGLFSDVIKLVQSAARQIGDKAKIEAFEKVAGAVSAAAKAVGDIISASAKVADFAEPLPETLDAVAASMGAVLDRMRRLSGSLSKEAAEKVQQVAGATSAAFGALGTAMETLTSARDFEGFNADAIATALEGVSTVLGHFRGLANAFGARDLSAIEVVARAATAAGEALQAGLAPLTDLRSFVGPSPGAVQDLIGHIYNILSDLAGIGGSISKEALAGVMSVAAATKAAAGALQEAIRPLLELRTFIGPSPAAVQDVIAHIFNILRDLASIAGSFKGSDLSGVRQVADSAKSALGAIGEAIAPLTNLRTFIGPSPAAVQDVIGHVFNILRDLAGVATRFAAGDFDRVRSLSDAVQAAVGALSASLEPLTRLRSFTPASVAQVTALVSNLDTVIAALRNVGQRFDATDLTNVSAVGQAVQAAFGGLAAALQPLADLRTFAAPSAGAIDGVFRQIEDVAGRFRAMAVTFKTEQLAAVRDLATATDAAFGALKGALDVLPGLADANLPDARRGLARIGDFIEDWVRQMAAIAGRVTQAVGAEAATFAESAAKVVALLGAGVDGFSKLEGLREVTPEAVRRFGTGVERAVAELARVAKLASGQLTREAVQFSEDAQKALGVLGSAASLASLGSFVAPSRQRIQQFVNAMFAYVGMFVAEARKIEPQIARQMGQVGEEIGKAFGGFGEAVNAFVAVGDFNPGKGFDIKFQGIMGLIRESLTSFSRLAVDFPNTGALANLGGALSSIADGVQTLLEALGAELDTKNVAETLAFLDRFAAANGSISGLIEIRKTFRLEVDVNVRSSGATPADGAVATEVGQQSAEQIATYALRLLREELGAA